MSGTLEVPVRWLVFLTAACLLAACPPPVDDGPPPPGPLGIPTAADGVMRAGAAALDITPVITETFTDTDGDYTFTGDLDDPDGSEPFEDLDGDGVFEPVWIGGFGPGRPARTVRDPITARALLLARDGSYVALVSLDLVGLANPRIDDAAAILSSEDGFDPDRLVVTSTHNHQGPDTMGLWGDPLGGVPGFDEVYQRRITDAIVGAVRAAAERLEPVSLTVGAVRLRDLDPYLTGSAFGGKGKPAKMHGAIHDIRDPVIAADQVLALQGTADGEVTFTLTSFSAHPEVRGSGNDALSSDFVGVTRDVLESRYGGIAVHIPECLGGMQSALGGDLPLVLEDGSRVADTCAVDDERPACAGKSPGDVLLDADGAEVPVFAERDSWDFVRSNGWIVAEGAIAALEAGEALDGPLRVMAEDGYVPIRNLAYNLLGPQGIFDLPISDAVLDPALCPEAADVRLGCLPFRVFRIELGDLGFVTAPGELLPELAWGFPTDDPQWVAEAADPAARGPDSRYFPQHPPACDSVPFADCIDTTGFVGECDCLRMHAVPYVIADDPALGPVLSPLTTKYRAAISMTSTYLSYIIPEGDVNRAVDLLADRDGDHYEDTVTPAYDFGTLYLEAAWRLHARWDEAP
jgi:hypothetical protein